jgi:hypothetical protein
VPDAPTVTGEIVGFCREEEKLFGPVHVYVAPAIVSADNISVCPAHTGLFDVTTGEGGLVLTRTTTVPTGLVHPFTVTVNE